MATTVALEVMSNRIRATREAGDPVQVGAEERHGFGLCLSGGGYRAALFHLGAARRLHELGALNRVDTISAVSGGALFAGVLAQHAMEKGWRDGLEIDNFEDIAKKVHALTSRDIRTAAVIMPGSNTRNLERLLDRNVSSKMLSELPDRPEFIFCATDMTYGVNFEISRDNTGSYKFENPLGAEGWPIAFALAASACFPPVFKPIRVRRNLRRSLPEAGPLKRRLSRTDLSDGGLYDNLGLEPVLKSHAEILVSDGGAPFQETPMSPIYKPFRHFMRYSKVARRPGRALRVTAFNYLKEHETVDGALWDLGVSRRVPNAGYDWDLIDDCIGRVRTDLDHFSEDERKILENHGYWSVEDQLLKDGVKERLSELLDDDAPEASAPHEKLMDEDRVKRALRYSHKWLLFRRLLKPGCIRDHTVNSFELLKQYLRGARGQAG